MRLRRVAFACVAVLTTSTAAFAQGTNQAQAGGTTITERSYPTGGFAPLRTIQQRRSQPDGREIVVVTEEQPGPEGRWEPVEEVVTETDRSAPGGVRTKRDVFVFDFDRRPTLLETTESSEERLSGGDTRVVEDTSILDVNGRWTIVSRWLDEGRTVGPGVRETNTTLFRRDINGSLEETERTTHTEQQAAPGTVQYDTTHGIRDPNRRWMPIETRSGDVRETGGERVKEETIRRPGLTYGTLVASDRIVTRQSEANGQQQVTIETYSQHADGYLRTDGRLALSQRIRRSTSNTADGNRTSIEEVEARNRVSPADPMRVVQRTVVTIRNVSPDRRVTERQLFERDLNGRLALVMTEVEETAN